MKGKRFNEEQIIVELEKHESRTMKISMAERRLI